MSMRRSLRRSVKPEEVHDVCEVYEKVKEVRDEVHDVCEEVPEVCDEVQHVREVEEIITIGKTKNISSI